jgi:hypothetical protein
MGASLDTSTKDWRCSNRMAIECSSADNCSSFRGEVSLRIIRSFLDRRGVVAPLCAPDKNPSVGKATEAPSLRRHSVAEKCQLDVLEAPDR